MLTGGDVEEERFVHLKYPPAVVLPDAGLSAPSWSVLVYEQACNGCKKGEPWCGLSFEATNFDPTTGVSKLVLHAGFDLF
jgi:hypothetical protein